MTTRSLSIAAPFLSRTPALTAPERGPSFLGHLAQVGDMLAQRLSLPHQLELRFLRAARQGRPVVLGSVERPFLARGSALANETNFSPLEVLREFDGLQVELVTRPEDVLRHRHLLAELDRQHAVTVELILPGIDQAHAEVREALRTVRALTDLGLAVRAVVRLTPAEGTRQALRQLFERVCAMGAFDVRWVAEGEPEAGAAEELEEFCRCLRLEQGFPRAVVGRG